MQKNEFLTFSGAEKLANNFVYEMRRLPKGTPLLISDRHGKICFERNLGFSHGKVENVLQIISEKERNFYLSQKDVCDCMTLGMEDNYGGEFLVLSKNQSPFFGGVICSCSEDDCNGMDEYIEKLGTLKDFLDSFSSMSLSEGCGLPLKREFEARIDGAFYLSRLSKDAAEFDYKGTLSVPCGLLVQKTSAFVLSCGNGAKIVYENDDMEQDETVDIPAAFVEMFILCLALALKLCKNKTVYVKTERVSDTQSMLKIQSTINNQKQNTSVFESAVFSLLDRLNISFSCRKDENFGMEFVLENTKKKKITFAETDYMLDRIDDLLSAATLQNMFFTIAN
ncbi:MAG: hypothetical protein E7600_05435 [Ruminococcaceae bacterium]|nr:hypothetical protein [Oscillospiraceae bacterium]